MKNIYIFLLLFLPFLDNAQYKELHFSHLTNKNSQLGNFCTAMSQDKLGYMWVGTESGLARFDGYGTKVYALGTPARHNTSRITQIYEDRHDNLWIGTNEDGLFWYNRGADTFVQYAVHTNNTSLLGANNVVSISVDLHNNLWVLTGTNAKKTVDFIDTKTVTATHFGNVQAKGNIIDSSINAVLADNTGTTWIGTNGGVYVYRYNTNRLEYLPGTGRDGPLQGCWGFCIDPKEPWLMWMLGGNNIRFGLEFNFNFYGVARYDTKKHTYTYFGHDAAKENSICSDSIAAVIADKLGQVWFASSQGLSKYDAVAGGFVNYRATDKQKIHFRYGAPVLMACRDGSIWYAADADLLFLNNATKRLTRYVFKYNDPDGPAWVEPNKILTGSDDVLWIYTVGVHWLNSNRSAITRYKSNDTIYHKFPMENVISLTQARDSTFFLSSDEALYRWYPKTDAFQRVEPINQLLKKDYIRTIITSRDGKIWMGMGRHGVVSYDAAHKITRYVNDGLHNSNSAFSTDISCLYEDHLGTIWIGTYYQGLSSYDPTKNKFTKYPFTTEEADTSTVNKALASQYIGAIYEDAQGDIWIGSDTRLCFFKKDKGEFNYIETPYADFKNITAIYQDKKGYVWAGTFKGGLFRLNKKTGKVERFTEKDGLLSNTVYDIREDSLGRCWFLCPAGFTILNPQTNMFSRFTTKNGLPDVTFLYNPEIYKAKDGRFLIGCDNGFFSFKPEDISPDTIPPIVHIESISFANPATNRPQDSLLYTYGKNTIRLRYNENRITFNYIGLQYQYTEFNQYAYKLDGYDNNWAQAGTQRVATYNNLTPGTYVFHVKSANSDGVWSINDVSITVIITPPWWGTWWAYILYAAAVASAIWLFIYHRSKKLLHDNKILERKIKLRTAEVLEQKEEITAQRDNLEKTLAELQATQKQLIQSEKMASLGELTAGIAHEIQNPLNFVNNFSEVNKDLLAEMKYEMENGNLGEAKAIANDVISNEDKISYHGRRADAIVKGMLQHSRSSTGREELTDINALCDEYLRLSYHGLRAKDKSFNAEMHTSFDGSIGKINIIPQNIGRVLLNLYNNAFYAVNEKAKTAGPDYKPSVSVSVQKAGDEAIITVSDNGNGIPDKIKGKIFQPFFTTKPTGQGTGLGLSLSYDIVKAHGAEISVETKEGEGTKFIIQIPYKS